MAPQDPLDFLGFQDEPADSRKETLANLEIFIRIRWFIAPGIFLIQIIASLIGFSVKHDITWEFISFHLSNTLIMLVLNFIYSLLVKRVKDIKPLIYLQLFIDAMHISLTIYKTGGVSSPFIFLYYAVIFAGAIFVSSKAAFSVAGMCGAIFVAIFFLESEGIIPHQDYFIPLSGLRERNSYALLVVIFTSISLLIIAYLAAYLTRENRSRRKRLKETNEILDKKMQTMYLLHRISDSLNRYDTVDQIVNEILNDLLSFLNLDRALFYLNKKDKELKLHTVKFKDEDRGKDNGPGVIIPLTEDAGLTAHAALTKQSFNIRHPEESDLINKELAKKIGLNPFALAPIVVRGELIGIIGIDRSAKNGFITDEEFQILKIFANQAGISLVSLVGKP